MTPPAAPPARPDLPHPLTFFLTARQRSAVLRALRRTGQRSRADALLLALNIDADDPPPPPQQPKPSSPRKGGPHDRTSTEVQGRQRRARSIHVQR